MAIRGTVTLECDTKGCHGELVLGDLDADTLEAIDPHGITVEFFADSWQQDEDGNLHCPQCCEENPREKGDDDGREYGHPGDRLAGRE